MRENLPFSTNVKNWYLAESSGSNYSSIALSAKGLKKNDLVVLETTVPVGTTAGRIRNLLEKGSRLEAGKDFFLAFSPEHWQEAMDRHIRLKLLEINTRAFDWVNMASFEGRRTVPFLLRSKTVSAVWPPKKRECGACRMACQFAKTRCSCRWLIEHSF